MSYSFPYLLLILVLFVLYLIETKKVRLGNMTAKSAVWTAYVLMWWFIGFRGHIMSDFISYYPVFNGYPNLFHLTSVDFMNGFEPGFNIYMAITKVFTSNYFAWVAVSTFIDIAIWAWFFRRYCSSMILPLIFFVAFNGLLIEFNLYRNVKAIDLFLLSVPYLQQRRWLPYFALNLLGLTFHTSAIIYFPLYFILNRRMSPVVMWGGFIVANLIFIFNIGIISSVINNISFIQTLQAYDKITNYAATGTEFKFSMGYIERTMAFIIFSVLYGKLTRHRESNILFYNCYWIYYCTFLVFYEVSVFVERIPTLFMFAYWVLYPNLAGLKFYWRRPLEVAITLLVCLKITSTFNYAGASYQNILTDKIDYYQRRALIEEALGDRN